MTVETIGDLIGVLRDQIKEAETIEEVDKIEEGYIDLHSRFIAEVYKIQKNKELRDLAFKFMEFSAEQWHIMLINKKIQIKKNIK